MDLFSVKIKKLLSKNKEISGDLEGILSDILSEHHSENKLITFIRQIKGNEKNLTLQEIIYSTGKAESDDFRNYLNLLKSDSKEYYFVARGYINYLYNQKRFPSSDVPFIKSLIRNMDFESFTRDIISPILRGLADSKGRLECVLEIVEEFNLLEDKSVCNDIASFLEDYGHKISDPELVGGTYEKLSDPEKAVDFYAISEDLSVLRIGYALAEEHGFSEKRENIAKEVIRIYENKAKQNLKRNAPWTDQLESQVGNEDLYLTAAILLKRKERTVKKHILMNYQKSLRIRSGFLDTRNFYELIDALDYFDCEEEKELLIKELVYHEERYFRHKFNFSAGRLSNLYRKDIYSEIEHLVDELFKSEESNSIQENNFPAKLLSDPDYDVSDYIQEIVNEKIQRAYSDAVEIILEKGSRLGLKLIEGHRKSILETEELSDKFKQEFIPKINKLLLDIHYDLGQYGKAAEYAKELGYQHWHLRLVKMQDYLDKNGKRAISTYDTKETAIKAKA